MGPETDSTDEEEDREEGMDEETDEEDEDEEDARPSVGPATAATHRSGIRGGCSVEAADVVRFPDGDDQDGEEPDVAAA